MNAPSVCFDPDLRLHEAKPSFDSFAATPASTLSASLSAPPSPTRRPIRVPSRKVLVATRNANSAFLRGLARYAAEARWHLITDMIHTGTLPRRWDGDGILAFAPYNSDITRFMVGLETPCVTVSLVDQCKSEPRFELDNFAIGRLAAEHLMERNCREFLWAPFADDLPNRERFDGFLSVVALHGCSCERLPPAHTSPSDLRLDEWAEWRVKVSKKLQRLTRRTGLFAFNDCLSAELATLALETGLRVPETLAILGVGNEPVECESGPVQLSSVNPNVEEMAYQASQMLEKLMDDPEMGRDLTVKVHPGSISARESTALSGSATPRTEQALEFIALNYSDPNLSVASVADSLGISRRQLERDFRNERGYTVREFIEQTRMKEASRLLLNQPGANVTEVARLVGISPPGNFFRIFRKRFGATPAAYRELQLCEHPR